MAMDEFSREVSKEFRKEGIEIPYPQINIHIRKD